MKKFFINHHSEIDVWSVKMFLYFLFVCIFLLILNWLNNELLCAILALILPCFIINKQMVNYINKLLHIIFGFRR